MKTNEQSVVEIERQLSAIKEDYLAYLTPIVQRIRDAKQEPSFNELIACQQIGNKYFNFLETFVGQSDLLGAHDSGLWVTGFAETCSSVLQAYIYHIKFLRSYIHTLGVASVEPDPNAFANMQRIVKKYLKVTDSERIRRIFEENNLPISGFLMDAHQDVQKVPKWQILTSVTIGSIAVILVLTLSIFIPSPSAFQMFIFRGIFAVGLGAIIAIVPGFINVNARINGFGNYVKVMAGGAIAVFVLTMFFNPPEIKETHNNQSIKVSDKKEN